MHVKRQLPVHLLIRVATILSVSFGVVANPSGGQSTKVTERFRIPDFDGTETSCRCKGLQAGTGRARWPPPRIPEDLACDDGSIDLTLCVPVNKTQRGLPRQGPFLPGSEDWLRLGKGTHHDMFPLDVNASKIVEDLMHGRAVTHVQLMWKTRDLCFFICLFIKSPIWNPNIKLLRQSRTCSAHDQVDAYRLVVVYKSGVFNFDERAQLRDNYANLPSDVRVVFVTGQPASSRSARQASSFQMNGGYKLVLRQRTAAKRRNEKWATRSREARERLLDEADEHGDLVVGDFVDTYVNLTYKMLTSHRWASAFCQGKTDVFLFMDDDFRFNVERVVTYLSGLSQQRRRQILGGKLLLENTLTRPSRNAYKNKWAMSEDEVPWTQMPAYVWGAAYLVGAEVLDDLVITEGYTRFLWVDDIYLGFVVAKLPHRSFVEISGFNMESKNINEALVAKQPKEKAFDWVLILSFTSALILLLCVQSYQVKLKPFAV